MDVINYQPEKKLLTLARGHPYDRDAFHALTQPLAQGPQAFDICHVEQPVAQTLLNAQTPAAFDALLCYDMPGIDFTADNPPQAIAPDPAFQNDYLAMLDAGIGIVFLHHALAAWPSWELYAQIIGGRFHYREATLRGKRWPDSGYRHNVTHTVEVLADHPVTAGLPERFEMTDELYLCPQLTDDVIPLLRSQYQFSDDNFYSAAHAVVGDMFSQKDWSHPPGGDLVGWVKHWGNSPIVYLQGGDDATAMTNPHFQTLVHNAVRWVSSADAREWARKRP